MRVLALVLAALVGVLLGLLGGGGSILTVPILTYVAGMPAQEAVASSLFVVGLTSAVSVLGHAKAGHVRWRTGLVFGLAGMLGAFAGGYLGGFIPDTVLLILFALVMLAAGAAMVLQRSAATASGPRWSTTLLVGLGVGFITGLVGAGGGFLIVPALALFAGLPMAAAVGTSLLVIAMNSLAGLGGHLLETTIDWPFVLAFAAAAVLGSFVGLAFVRRLSGPVLRRIFGFFVLAMGLTVLALEVPALL